MSKKKYNWWEDPKNEQEVKRFSWWNDERHKETFPLPISVIQSGDVWVVGSNDDTKKHLGEICGNASQGGSKEDALINWFYLIRITHRYDTECRLSYQRWVPFRRGGWKGPGSKWFAVFGIHVYFRFGKNMKGGRYIPFTKLNISIYSEWATYRNWKKENPITPQITQ